MAYEEPPIVKFRFKRATPERWMQVDPVLAVAEPGYEIGTGRIKIGDGVLRWSQLDYPPMTAEIREMIAAALAELGGGGEIPTGDLALHVNDPTPHPAYDDGPSFALLYQNAKV